MAVYRVYVEKSPEYAVEAQGLLKEIRHILLIKSVTGVRVLNRYDVEGIEQALFDRCMPVVFSEPPVDVTYDRLPEGADAVLEVPARLMSQYVGQHGCNRDYLVRKFGLHSLKFIPSAQSKGVKRDA